jgi:uncharacterized protein (TIGR03435 family)
MTNVSSAAILLVACGLLFAQPAIDVASIKPSDPGINAMNNHFSADRYNYVGYSAQFLIEGALGVKDYQVLNTPGWLRSERWDLDIKSTMPANPQQRDQLILALLADRFRFKFHHETRTMPIYSLVVAKGGAKLKKADPDERSSTTFGNQIIGRKYDITMLAPSLSGELNMPVVDNTGLTGIYDIDLKWSPDPARPEFGDVRNPADLPAPDPNRPEIFTAIKEQLGLELKAERGPVDVIVIDHIDRPTPN